MSEVQTYSAERAKFNEMKNKKKSGLSKQYFKIINFLKTCSSLDSFLVSWAIEWRRNYSLLNTSVPVTNKFKISLYFNKRTLGRNLLRTLRGIYAALLRKNNFLIFSLRPGRKDL